MSAIDIPSRSPADYHPTAHAGQMVKERQIPGWAIRDAIENGEPEPDGETTVRISSTCPGPRYELVIDTADRAVVTAYLRG